MNKQTVGILSFIGGGVTGLLVANQYLKTKYEDILNEELEDIRNYREKKMKNGDVEKDRVLEEEMSTSYNNITKIYGGSDGEYEEYNVDPKDFDDVNEPYTINPDQFSSENLNFDKEIIYYYDDDNTFADTDEEIIANPGDILGEEPLACFGEPSITGNTVYVRNEKTSTDYEIICVPGSYSKLILGMKEE